MEKVLHRNDNLRNNLFNIKNYIMKDPLKVVVICLTVALFAKLTIIVIESVEKKQAKKAKTEKTK